jgi:hypothetical protein
MNEVNAALTRYTEAADCICPGGGCGEYENSGTALEFIEQAVRESLAARKDQS